MYLNLLFLILMQRNYIIRSCLKVSTSADCQVLTSDQSTDVGVRLLEGADIRAPTIERDEDKDFFV